MMSTGLGVSDFSTVYVVPRWVYHGGSVHV